MKKIIFLIAFIFLLFFNKTLGSELINPHSNISYLGIEQGLSNNDVNCLYQSKQGYIWIGTTDGLNQYDGNQITVYRKELNKEYTLPSNHILDIMEDAEQNILISTKSGLIRFNPIRKSFEPVYALDKKGIKQVKIQEETIIERWKDQLFVGSVKYGLLKSKAKNQLQQIPLKIGNQEITNFNVRDINSTHIDKIVVLIENYGIALYDPSKNELQLVNSAIKFGNSLVYQGENLIIGTDEGIFLLDHHYQQIGFQKIPRPVIKLQNFGQQVWSSTDGAGIYIKDQQHANFQLTTNFGARGIFSSNSIKDILLDKDQHYWIATVRGGVNIMSQQKRTFNPYLLRINEQLTDKDAFLGAFCEINPDEVWVGTDGYGLYSFKKSTGQFNKLNIPNLKSDHITSIVKDKNGQIWVATWGGGIHLYDANQHAFKHYNFQTANSRDEIRNIWKLYLDKRGELWASSYGNGGVFKWDEQESAFRLYCDDFKNVLTFTEDAEGQLWMGSDDYLIRHNLKTKKNMYFSFGYRIRTIIPNSNGTLWIGTEGNGLIHFDKRTGKYVIYDETKGLSNNNILNILQDQQGKLWLSTFNGLNIFDPKTKKVTKFSEADGLQSNRFNYLSALQLSNSDLIFGGSKGLNWFSPKEIEITDQKLNTVLTGVKINGVDITEKQNWTYVKDTSPDKAPTLDLPYDKRFISINFSSFVFNKANQPKYFAKLEGLSDEWIDLGSVNYLNYSKLPAGTYKLFIRAMGQANTVYEANILNFSIAPAWYWNPLSISIYVLLVLLTLYIYLKISKNRTKLIYEKKLALVQKEKEKEIGQKKLQFFTETLQELKTPITMVINPLTELMKNEHSEQNKDLQFAYRNANRLIVLLEQINVLKQHEVTPKLPSLKKVDLISVLHTEFDSFKQLAENKGLSFTIKHNLEELYIYANAQKLELIIFNLILHAIENAEQNGKVSIELLEKEDTVLIRCIDSGAHQLDYQESDFFEFYHSFKDEDKQISLELLMIYQMVKEHYGTFQWQSAGSTGNMVSVELNKGQWYKTIHPSSLDVPSPPMDTLNTFDTGAVELEDKSNPIIISNRESILIIENDQDMLSYLKGIFKLKYQVYAANHIDEAWKILEVNQPNLILTEVFDDGEGFDLLKKIKEDSNYSHLPVLFLTSSGSTEEELKGITLGAEEFITKPFDQEILLAKVQSIIDGRTALQQYFLDNITLKENHSKISLANKQFLDCCIEIVEENLSNSDFNAQMLAKRSNMSYSNLYKKVRSISGLSISAFIRAIRLKKAAVLMLSTENTINEIAYEVGIQDIKYFREKFKSIYGMSPSIYIKKYRPLFNKEFRLIKKTG